MNKTCKGCGVTLQNENAKSLGYSPKEDSEYCQRCFRLTHYNDVVISMQQGIDNDALLSKVNALDALVLWVVDILDFESSIFKGMNRHLLNKDIVMICTKSDLMPRDVNPNKLGNFIMHRLKEHGIYIKGIVMCPNMHKQDEDSVQLIQNAITQFRDESDVVLIGNANAGKSTLLNALLQSKALTTSIHPGTTLDINPIAFEEYTLYDTPGLVSKGSLLTYVDDALLKEVIFQNRVNPKKFQLTKDQSLSIGGLVRLDLMGCENTSVVCYFSERLNVHRTKVENADELWKNHLNYDILVPSLDDEFSKMKKYTSSKKTKKMDVAIAGLGWFCIHGNVKEVRVFVNEKVDITFREAMI